MMTATDSKVRGIQVTTNTLVPALNQPQEQLVRQEQRCIAEYIE